MSKSKLLKMSKKEREKFFEEYTVQHPKLHQVKNELKKELYTYGDFGVIMIVGPSGVGKSRLFEETMKSIIEEKRSELESDKSIIPVTGIEVPYPDLRMFNWKDIYYRTLVELNEPLIDKKINTHKEYNFSNKNKTSPVHELRRSLENALRFRKTEALLFDEGQHFFNLSTGKGIDTQFNSLKSLANMTDTQIMLFGTYSMNETINFDAQLSRRVKEIHFPRYNYDYKKDVNEFCGVLLTFQKILPLKEEPDLIKNHVYMYEGSVGCVGVLKNWLQRCLSEALELGDNTITLDNLKRNALNPKKLYTLAEEVIDGESYFVDSDEAVARLKNKLNTKKDEEESNRRKAVSKPGTRNPSRDKVGKSNDDNT